MDTLLAAVSRQVGVRVDLHSSDDPLAYYARPGFMTDPQEYSDLLSGLPTDVGALCSIVQGVLVHLFWSERYGLTLSDDRKREVQIRPVARMLARIRALSDRPLTVARPPEQRLVGNCRHFATLLCAVLRQQGVPARARCGFARYFEPDHYEDHWICEYWASTEQRWVGVDAQLDQLQRRVLGIHFDPLDVPPDQFLTAGKAWQMCRAGAADPGQFGILDKRGIGFVRGNLVRDMLALNKMEVLPWDGWGLVAKPEEEVSQDERELLDYLATITLAGNEGFSQVRSAYEQDARIRVPPGWPAR